MAKGGPRTCPECGKKYSDPMPVCPKCRKKK